MERIVPDVADEETRDLKSYIARYKAALIASDQGDLIIEIPRTVVIEENQNVSFFSIAVERLIFSLGDGNRWRS